MPSEKDGGTKLALPKRKTLKQPHPNTFRRHPPPKSGTRRLKPDFPDTSN
ncbi:TPA: hypothetical protein ACFP4U_002018 [Neisseria lactamica]|uniref:Uncharacterized protein n=1 Tax=Neisseria lactamica (strain 020-06) TaxID=489653 RepID=E4ZC21_NEIL0|nr:hypothetical protein [Neisseria lactamica]CBN86899.1 hypothetical protein NLA_6630 [Neisseria lactamica 020-06]